MDSPSPKVFVVILNFNGASILPECLSSVFQSDYTNFEVVVVDNDSKDGSFEQARLNYSRAHLIKNSANVGFSKGNNVGIRWALEKFADYVLVLNNDALIEKNTISLLEKIASANTAAGIVSPAILNINKSVWFAGGTIDWNKMRTVHLRHPVSSSPYPSEYISGCAMFVKKEVFQKIGLFDERFFLYYEDADFSLRARKAGFELLVDPSISIQHAEQSNRNNPLKTYWLVLSGLIFFKTHASTAQKFRLSIYVLLRKIKNFYKVYFSKDVSAPMVRKAYKDFKKLPR